VTLTCRRRCMWLLSGRVWSMHRACGRLIRRYIRRGLNAFNTTGLGWTTQPLLSYESRCLLLGLEVLSDRRKIAAALFVRDILCVRGSSPPTLLICCNLSVAPTQRNFFFHFVWFEEPGCPKNIKN
jgi:hypothetical protein